MKKTVYMYRIYLDHGEAYGNLGDEAMLISAINRLNTYLGNCEFIIPIQNGRPLPELPANTQFVATPRLAFRMAARLVKILFHLTKHLPYFKQLVPSRKEELNILIWKNVDRILAIFLPLLLRFPNKLAKTINILKTCDIFYGVGAADFNDFNLEDFAYKSWLYKTAKRYVKVVVVSSQGIGPLYNQWARKKMKEALEQIHYLSFRDYYHSKLIVDELCPKNVKYFIVGDEAFSLPIAEESAITTYLEEAGLPYGAKFIAFHFRETDYTKRTSFLIPYISSLLDEISKITSHYIVFFPMSYHLHSTYDEECGKKIKQYMSRSEQFLIAPLCKNVRIVKGAVGRALFSLGLSYHIHIFALSQNKPAIILYSGEYYKYKSEGLISFYGEPCKALDLVRSERSEILKSIQDLERNYEEAINKIGIVNKKLHKVNDWHIKEMLYALQNKKNHKN